MTTKNILILAGIGVAVYLIAQNRKKSTTSTSEHSNALGGYNTLKAQKRCRCRNALGGYTDMACPCPAPSTIFGENVNP